MKILVPPAVLAAAFLGAPPDKEVREVWAGHAVAIGHRRVPLLGEVEARTESYVLAEVRKTAGKMKLEQTSCAIDLSNPTGVKLALSEGAAERLPPVELVFERRPEGVWVQVPATSGWTAEDVDGDGHPGMTVHVDAPVCGGRLFVGLTTRSISRGGVDATGRFSGEMKAHVKQRILETDGTCLSILIRDTEESLKGVFAYVPVAKDATCASLLKGAWPVRASAKVPPRGPER